MNRKALISVCTTSLLVVSLLFYVSVINNVKYEVNSVYEGWFLRFLDDECYISLFTLNEEVFWMIERDVVLKLTLSEINEVPGVIKINDDVISIVKSYFPGSLHVNVYVTDVVLNEYIGGDLDPILTSSLNTYSNILTGAINYNLKLEVIIIKDNFTINHSFNLKAIHPARMYSLISLLNKFNEQLSSTIKSYILTNTSINMLSSKILIFLKSFSENNLKNKYFGFDVVLKASVSRIDNNLYHVYIHILEIRFSDILYHIKYMGLNSLASVSRRGYSFHHIVNDSNVETGSFTIKYSYP
ncbi:MAG: hypothetical protein QXY40_08195 [Candidatus Methanomethylicia archaeon]